MNERTVQTIYGMIDDYFEDPDLSSFLKTCLDGKEREGSRWSDITRYTHYMLGGSSPLIENNAALTEAVILALDIADDLQDQDSPDKPWMARPPEIALNAVLSFLSLFAAEAAVSASTGKAARLLARSVAGQQKDLNGSVQTEGDYMNMIHQKSGSLLCFACLMGYSLIPGLEEETLGTMNDLAECIGVIAQLENDLKDLIRMDRNNDLVRKKRTLPILYLLRYAERDCPAISRYYGGSLSESEFVACKQECLDFIHESGCIEYTKVIQSLYIERANELLEALPAASPWKEKFKEATIAPRHDAVPVYE